MPESRANSVPLSITYSFVVAEFDKLNSDLVANSRTKVCDASNTSCGQKWLQCTIRFLFKDRLYFQLCNNALKYSAERGYLLLKSV